MTKKGPAYAPKDIYAMTKPWHDPTNLSWGEGFERGLSNLVFFRQPFLNGFVGEADLLDTTSCKELVDSKTFFVTIALGIVSDRRAAEKS